MHEVFICLLFSSNLSRFIGKLKFIDSFLMRKKYGNIIILTIVYIEEKKIIIIFFFCPLPTPPKKKNQILGSASSLVVANDVRFVKGHQICSLPTQ